MNASEAGSSAPAVSPVLDRTFKVGLALKAADGVIEIVAGVLLLLISPSSIQRIARAVTAHELGEDPHDRLSTYILHSTEHLSSGTTLFGAIYLLSTAYPRSSWSPSSCATSCGPTPG